MSGTDLWRRKSDQDVLEAVSRFHEYTEVGQAILREEMQRRGLPFPAAFASSCLNCGAPIDGDEPLCGACRAAVEVTTTGIDPAAVVTAPFFEVATQKFAVMSVCTFGLYSLYWFYQNWKRINAGRQRIGGRNLVALSALFQAFFAPVWAYALFREVRSAALAAGVEVRWRPWILAIGYFVTNMFYRLPNQAVLLSLTSVVFLLPVQQAMQHVNRAHGAVGDQNARYGPGNIACIVLGVSMLVVVLLSPLLSPPT